MRFQDRSFAFQCAATTAAAVDPLEAFSDFFVDGDVDMPDRGWTRVDDTTTPAGDGRWTNLVTTLGSGYLAQIDAGGGTGSFHLNNNRGVQWYKIRSEALWGCDCRITLRNAADTGDPPGTNYRLGGILAHDVHSDANADHVAICWGTANGAFPRAYWNHTVNGSSGVLGNTTPGFNVSATLTGATRWLRMLRDFANSDRWVLQHKANEGDAWTTIRDVQRGVAAMPGTVYVGPVLFSDQATHDVAARFHSVRFFTPKASDFP